MTTLRECADTAAAALVDMLRTGKGGVDTAAVADIIERVLNQAMSETEAGAQRLLVDLEAPMQRQLTRLLDASPAVIYSFKAKDDFASRCDPHPREPTRTAEGLTRMRLTLGGSDDAKLQADRLEPETFQAPHLLSSGNSPTKPSSLFWRGLSRRACLINSEKLGAKPPSKTAGEMLPLPTCGHHPLKGLQPRIGALNELRMTNGEGGFSQTK